MRRSLAQRVARFGDGEPFLFNGAALPYWLSHSRADASPRATYFGSDGLIKTVAAAGDPRIDFTPGKRPGLLVESARANLLLNANNFVGGGWGGSNLSFTAGAAASPDGTVNATKLDETAVNSFHISTQSVAAAAGDYVAGRFFKQVERQWAALQIATDGATKRATVLVDLATGAVAGTNTTGSPLNVAYGTLPLASGWIYVWIKATNTSGNVYAIGGLSNSASPAYVASAPSYLGVLGSGLYSYGAQLEAGSYPTSYIATGAAAVSRAADALSMAARATDPLIVQTRSLVDGARARTLLYPASDVSTLADVVIEAAKLYPAGTPAGALSGKLTVDGPW